MILEKVVRGSEMLNVSRSPKPLYFGGGDVGLGFGIWEFSSEILGQKLKCGLGLKYVEKITNNYNNIIGSAGSVSYLPKDIPSSENQEFT